MNFSARSLSMPSSAADSGVGLVVLSKALDSAEVAGEHLTEMMQEAAPVVRGMGLGEFLDVRA